MKDGVKYFLYFLLIVGIIILLLFLYGLYLIEKSKPTFSKQDLEILVHTTVKNYYNNSNRDSDDVKYEKAIQYFDKSITESYKNNTGFVDQNTLIQAYDTECLLRTISQAFHEKFPDDAIDEPRWCYNEVGGAYARQLMLLANPTEYVCLWGTVLAKHSSFSGYYGNFLCEGDVVISGQIVSADPESELCCPRTYVFGQTSELKACRRREYDLSTNCYMISYGLHQKSNLITTMFVGVIFPYLFQNNDTKSFQIQFGDAMKGFMKWFKKQM
jgi:ERG2 and Sigma1 receptor like protein